MNKLFFFLCLCFVLWGTESYAQGYNIKITVEQMPNKNVILAHYFEGKVYATDTAKLDASGTGYFKKDKQKLGRGVYLLLFSPSNYFDMIIGDNQHFSIKTDTLNPISTFRVEGSPENAAFLDFLKFMNDQNSKSRKIREAFDKDPGKENPEVKKNYTEQYNILDTDVKNYISNISNKFPGSALATFSKFTLSPSTPDFSKEVPEGTKDRDREILKREYYHNKAHYWDNTNFADSTLIRTPNFKTKLDDYFENMVLMIPDSVYRECINIIEKSKKCKAMFRYMVSYCFNYTLESKIMGMDEAFINVAKKYYLTGQADWVKKEDLDKIKEEVIMTQYNLVGQKAQELKLPTIDGNWVSLYETKAPFTLLLFWESDCGHCKKQVPEIKHELLDKFKDYGLKVFAVHSKNNKEEWEKFVAEYDLFDFINCWDPHNQTNFRIYYHVNSTPVIYLLDKDKKIIAKKLDTEQLTDMLKREYKKQGIIVP